MGWVHIMGTYMLMGREVRLPMSRRIDSVERARAYEDGYQVGYDDGWHGISEGRHNIAVASGLGDRYDRMYQDGYWKGYESGRRTAAESCVM